MKPISYPRVNEQLFSETLPNGLEVRILPKEGFTKTYAVFSTRFGSIDNHFRMGDGSDVRVPDGIAHFLEHKMFEEREGDVFQKFAAKGASANAFTSFDRTAYLFSATDHIEENVMTLLDFVQNPYFTDENVEKEKGIIGQEIQMYGDLPDWRVYYGLIEAMYQNHPIHIDIAGTVESISKIDKETLYSCYHTFYHPGNMALFIVGGVEPQQLMAQIRANQATKTFPPYTPVDRFYPDEPSEIREKMKVTQLTVSLPKCLFGFKENLKGTLSPEQMIKQELTSRVLFDMLFSPSSTLYQTLYEENLISDQFGSDYQVSSTYAYSMIGGDTRDPDLLIERTRALLADFSKNGFISTDFERCRRKRIGGYLRLFNSPEAIANEYTKYRFKQIDFFEFLSIYESLTLEDVRKRFDDHFDWTQLAVSIVRSPS